MVEKKIRIRNFRSYIDRSNSVVSSLIGIKITSYRCITITDGITGKGSGDSKDNLTRHTSYFPLPPPITSLIYGVTFH